MSIDKIPDWMSNLESEDIVFIKNFIITSGSLKEIAKIYKVTYPTIRLRLDKIIQKIHIEENSPRDPYIALIKKFVIEDKIDLETAKILINEFKKNKKEEK